MLNVKGGSNPPILKECDSVSSPALPLQDRNIAPACIHACVCVNYSVFDFFYGNYLVI